MKKILLILALGCISGPLMAKGDAQAGKAKSAMCSACHGADGNSPAPTFPKIAGQNAKYIVKQLKDIKDNIRNAPQMLPFVMSLSDQDMEDLGAYYAQHTTTSGAAKKELVKLGESIYRAGIARKGIAACTACHSPTGSGNAQAAYPALRGQFPEYLEGQLKAFRDGSRNNDANLGEMMQAVAVDMSDQEIQAVASYIYGLQE